ncbi:hypothetical protein BH24ACT26_BH24ACT26_06940 [soil metagenome]
MSGSLRTLEDAMWGTIGVVGLVCLAQACRLLPRRAVEPRRRRVPPAGAAFGSARRAVSFLGFVVTMAASPAGAREGSSLPSRITGLTSDPPWSRTSGSPPPPPLVLTSHTPAPEPGTARATEAFRGHPALHGRRGPVATRSPLFPRARGKASERERSVRLHPAGKRRRRYPPSDGDPQYPGLFLYSNPEREPRRQDRREPYREPRRPGPGACETRAHVVAPGESLWSIASHLLGTDDAARIARLWPRIYELNRSVIGDDPDLVLPGQRLEVPDECDS